MCGRYSLTVDQEALQVALGVEGLVHPRPRYNIAPTQEVPIVREAEGAPSAAVMRWGLVPFWADDPAIGNRMINARAETAPEKPAFRTAFRRGRCLVPADGFYEWRNEDGRKVPFRIHLESDGVFTMAGLCDRWRSPEGEERETFTILTTDANELVRPIHARMPVILAPDDRAAWLDPDGDPDELRGLLDPFPSAALAVTEVSTRVNSPRHDDAACIAPAGTSGPSEEPTLFDPPSDPR